MRDLISGSAVRTTPLNSPAGFKMPRIFSCLALLPLLLIAAACSQQPGPAPAPDHAAASITAQPNPIPAGPGFGTSTISWNTGTGTPGQVYLAEGDKPEKLFAAESARGALDAPWIGAGAVYEFRLYEGTERKKLLASVKVVRADK
jgi:hypothetical protein